VRGERLLLQVDYGSNTPSSNLTESTTSHSFLPISLSFSFILDPELTPDTPPGFPVVPGVAEFEGVIVPVVVPPNLIFNPPETELLRLGFLSPLFDSTSFAIFSARSSSSDSASSVVVPFPVFGLRARRFRPSAIVFVDLLLLFAEEPRGGAAEEEEAAASSGKSALRRDKDLGEIGVPPSVFEVAAVVGGTEGGAWDCDREPEELGTVRGGMMLEMVEGT